MRNVIRPPTPDSLKVNAKKWTVELLLAIKANKTKGTKIPPKSINRYKQPDVLDSLKKMYGNGKGGCYCCYCESEVETVSYPHIEHRKPKSIYPELSFEWNNLHLACPKCNTAKGNQYDKANPILDAVSDIPISDHLGYIESDTCGIYRETTSDRGITTVSHSELDRESLRNARLKVYISVVRTIREISARRGDPRANTAIRMLRGKCSGEYGSLIQWILDQFEIYA